MVGESRRVAGVRQSFVAGDRPAASERTIHLEGRISIEAALAAGRRRIEVILVEEGADEEKLAELLAAARRRAVPVQRVGAADLEALAHGRSHGGVVAPCSPLPEVGESEFLTTMRALRTPPLLLLLDGADDERNLGFTLRTAEAFGAHAVLLRKRELDFDETALSRSSSGALERLPIVRVDRDSTLLRELRRMLVQVIACVAGERRAIWELDLREPALLCVGGEKRGLSAAVRDQCTARATIPMRSASTSLPMSHAAAVVLAEAARQRRDPSAS